MVPTGDPRKSLWWPVFLVAAAYLLLHLATAGNYGIFRDEYYYIACAKRLAWGYVDQPPLSIWLLALVRAILGDGVFALRLLPALSGAALIAIVAQLAATLGGGRVAQLLAALGMAIVGVVQVLNGFFSMNAFDMVFWVVAWTLLARWVTDPRPRWLVWLGLVLGLGLLNKIGLLVLGAALALALVATRHRRALATPWPWVAGALALALFLPYVLWQLTHDWPTLEFIANAKRFKISGMAPHAFLGEIVLEQHPANLVLWPVGLGWLLFGKEGRRFRLLGLTALFALALLMLQRAKPYYAAPLFPVLLAAGAGVWERLAARPRRAWLVPALVVWLVANWIFFLPLGVPVLPVGDFARWQAWTGIAPAAQEVGHTSELPQYYSDRFGWLELVAEVERITGELPPEERDRAVVIARNYGEAGALEYWSGRAGRSTLPPVVSGHNTYWFWATAELPLDTVIVVGWREEEVREFFADVRPAGVLEHPWALESGVRLWVAREPRFAWAELHENLRSFI